MPVGNVLVGDARGDIKHDDTALPVDVVPVSQPAEFLLPCRVPDIELDRSIVLKAVQYDLQENTSALERRTVVNCRG